MGMVAATALSVGSTVLGGIAQANAARQQAEVQRQQAEYAARQHEFNAERARAEADDITARAAEEERALRECRNRRADDVAALFGVSRVSFHVDRRNVSFGAENPDRCHTE